MCSCFTLLVCYIISNLCFVSATGSPNFLFCCNPNPNRDPAPCSFWCLLDSSSPSLLHSQPSTLSIYRRPTQVPLPPVRHGPVHLPTLPFRSSIFPGISLPSSQRSTLIIRPVQHQSPSPSLCHLSRLPKLRRPVNTKLSSRRFLNYPSARFNFSASELQFQYFRQHSDRLIGKSYYPSQTGCLAVRFYTNNHRTVSTLGCISDYIFNKLPHLQNDFCFQKDQLILKGYTFVAVQALLPVNLAFSEGKMWILLVMMTIVQLGGTKRVRKGPVPPSVDTTCEEGGSEQDPKLCTLRRSKRAMTSIDKTATQESGSIEGTQPDSLPIAAEEIVSIRTSKTTRLPSQTRDSTPNSSAIARGSGSTQDTQPTSLPISGEGNIPNTIDSMQSQSQQRKRGRNINKKASEVLEKINKTVPGARITLTRDIYTKQFVGDSATYFATEVGIVMRKFCPLEFHTWENVPNENKEEMIDRLREKFEIPQEDQALLRCVDGQLQRQWKRTRSDLKKYWNTNRGLTNPSLAKSKVDPNCRSPEDWEYMCKYWETDKAKKYADQMKENRKKLVIPSRGGSRSIANHRHAMTNKETQLPPYPIELYHKLRYKTKWINHESRIEYENIVKTKEEECAKLVSAGTTITPEMEYEIEQNAVTIVSAKSSQSVSKDEEDWKSKYLELEEEQRSTKDELRIYQEKVKHGEEKTEKVFQFMISKFPEARDMFCPPDQEKTSTNGDMDDLSDEE
ncbi:hypothetical protein LXL04_020608 [Taraxacum kok-saghyz]